MLESLHHLVSNGDGWQISLQQTFHPQRLDRSRRPVLIVPGYGMNSFIYSYHPSGLSLEGFLAEAGLEVWRADLRAQGDSVCAGGSDNFSLEDLALTDVGAAMDAVLERTRTDARHIDLLGGSLGGTLVLIHAVLRGTGRIGSLVCLGSPVRWVAIHPALRVAFGSPTLVGLVRFRGTRKLAEFALPLLARYTPWVLSVYMNPEITDVTAAREMVRTVEDPNRFINRQIARWMRERDLVLHGRNISDGLRELRNPLLCVLATGDGIVPPETAAFPYYQIGSETRRLLEVGSRTIAMAHADLFVSKLAHERVFTPIRDWLLEQRLPQPEQTRQRLE